MEWHPNGQVAAAGQISRDASVGRHSRWSPNGEISEVVCYDGGRRRWETTSATLAGQRVCHPDIEPAPGPRCSALLGCCDRLSGATAVGTLCDRLAEEAFAGQLDEAACGAELSQLGRAASTSGLSELAGSCPAGPATRVASDGACARVVSCCEALAGMLPSISSACNQLRRLAQGGQAGTCQQIHDQLRNIAGSVARNKRGGVPAQCQ